MSTEEIFDLIWKELDRASRAGHNAEFSSAHEAWAVIFKEVDEFWNQAKLKAQKRSGRQMQAELVQIAAMAVKALQSPIFPEDLETLNGPD